MSGTVRLDKLPCTKCGRSGRRYTIQGRTVHYTDGLHWPAVNYSALGPYPAYEQLCQGHSLKRFGWAVTS